MKRCKEEEFVKLKRTTIEARAEYKRKQIREGKRRLVKPANSQQRVTSYFKSDVGKYKPKEKQQQELTKKLIKSIAVKQLPLDIVECEAFIDLLKTADAKYHMPSRPTLRNTILPKVETAIIEGLRKELDEADAIYITLDLWSNKRRDSFIGITAHLVDATFDYKSFVLACDLFEERHSGDHIAEKYQEIMDKFNIAKKVKKVVADNASNITRAFEEVLPGFDEYINEDEENEDFNDDDDELLMEDSQTENDDDLERVPQRKRCFAHTEQLCLASTIGVDEFKQGPLGQLINRASKIINAIRSSTVAMPFLKKNGIVLQQRCKTRWNTELTSLKSILKNSALVNQALVMMKSKHKTLTPLDVSKLEEICSLLQPFSEAIEFVEGEKNATCSAICPAVSALHMHLSLLKRNGVCHTDDLLNALILQVESRLFSFLNDEDFRISTFLDPRFKNEKWISDSDEKEKLKRRVTDLVLFDIRNDREPAAPSPPHDDENQPKYAAAVGGIMSKMFADTQPNPPKRRCILATAETADFIVNEYMLSRPPVDNDVAGFWRNYPSATLRNVARRYLGCPATSAPSERLFSIAGMLDSARRRSMGPRVFQTLLLVKTNQILYNNIPSSLF